MQTEEELFISFKNKDEKALASLYDSYAGAIYGVILRMCRDEDQAKDLLQETFVKIWQNASSYSPERGRFYTWAYRIARNTTLNSFRKEKDLIQNEDLSVYSNKEDTTIQSIDTIGLNGALKKLEPHHKEAIELVYFKGLTHREAHEQMEVPLGTFKSYIKQALKKLRTSYVSIILLFQLLLDLTR